MVASHTTSRGPYRMLYMVASHTTSRGPYRMLYMVASHTTSRGHIGCYIWWPLTQLVGSI